MAVHEGYLLKDDLRAHCVHRPVVRLVCCMGRAPELGHQRPALVLELVHPPAQRPEAEFEVTHDMQKATQLHLIRDLKVRMDVC